MLPKKLLRFIPSECVIFCQNLRREKLLFSCGRNHSALLVVLNIKKLWVSSRGWIILQKLDHFRTGIRSLWSQCFPFVGAGIASAGPCQTDQAGRGYHKDV